MSAKTRSARDKLRAALIRLRPELPAGAPEALSRVPRSSRVQADVAPLLRSPIALLVQADHEVRPHPLAARRVERLRRRLAASA